jgi:tetraprenyl-beta-curcumene synthase
MGPIAGRRLRLAVAFTKAGCRYWLTVHPLVRWEIRRWRRRAHAIPDSVLQGTALDTLRDEAGNLEGAAAFAILAPLHRRPRLVRATIAFQTAFDYVDSLAERHESSPAGTRALHEALRDALHLNAGPQAYYRDQPHSSDGGYLSSLAETCRTALSELPSRETIAPHLLRAVERMIDYQALIHHPTTSPATGLAAWARTQRPPSTGLTWWEVAAAGASSLGVFALVAAAADRGLSVHQAAALDRAYFPWIGAVHVLLDSLVDQPDDALVGHHSLIEHYASPMEAAARLEAMATSARSTAESLKEGEGHVMLLVAMVVFYLVSPTALLPHAEPARHRVLAAFGDFARPAAVIMRARNRCRGWNRRSMARMLGPSS